MSAARNAGTAGTDHGAGSATGTGAPGSTRDDGRPVRSGPVGATDVRGPRQVGLLRQTYEFSRAEATLFRRYRTALYFALFPLVLALLGLAQEGTEIVPGVDAGAHYTVGALMMAPLFLSIMHVSNIVTARREQLVLKRLRVAGTAPAVMFGAVIVSVVLVTAVVSVLIGAVLYRHFGVVPVDPVLVVLPILLVTVAVSLFAIAFTRLCRNAESAQMLCFLPLMLFYGLSGLMLPLELMPDRLAEIARYLPAAAGVEIVTAAYLGRDFVGGGDGSQALAGADLWAAALPGLLVITVWTAVFAYLTRFFRWDPRESR
ncbi:ABC transporter permease [Nocardiopsis ganjiahuensis]|uniref:ABC transporter permease n=1 Tax=Nocardiopsis ganjiahuensis TaxID=239984 RepID=UPI0003492C00|nr:ABC transporter permease [Nocardiopsis ganjiahuensis]